MAVIPWRDFCSRKNREHGILSQSPEILCNRYAIHRMTRIFLALIFLFSSPAFAHFSTPAVTDQAAVRLIVGNQEASAIKLGLEFNIKPGWKVYWRTPGDVGVPVTLDWQ